MRIERDQGRSATGAVCGKPHNLNWKRALCRLHPSRAQPRSTITGGYGPPPVQQPTRLLPGRAAADEPLQDFDAYEVDAGRAETLDRLTHAWQARFTAYLSPAALALAFADWGVHLANALGKRGNLLEKALRKQMRFFLRLSRMGGDAERALASRKPIGADACQVGRNVAVNPVRHQLMDAPENQVLAR